MKSQCSMTVFTSFLVLFASDRFCSAAPAGQGFLSHAGGKHASGRMAMQEIEAIVNSAVDANADKETARQFAKIESSITHSYLALPKTASGGLAPRAVRHLVHSYFAKEHGWLINGLEYTGMRTDAGAAVVHEVDVLQDKAPALVEALIEAQVSEKGLPLRSVAAMVLVLERLIYDESLTLLESVYKLSETSTNTDIKEDMLRDVLLTYLALFRLGPDGNVSKFGDASASYVQNLKTEASLETALVDFQRSAFKSFDHAKRNLISPFEKRRYGFKEVQRIVGGMAEDYGKWQDEDCKAMKSHLMRLDPTNAGRVPLASFHSARTPWGHLYSFTESAEQLRELGALEESGGQSRVLVSNYLTSETNCLPASSYYSICCLHECELLMNELESSVRAPTARAEVLIELVSNLSSTSVEAPRRLRPELLEKLHLAAIRHGGEVPLHGRLFRQWLHYAFPHECPLPQGPVSTTRPSRSMGEIFDGREGASEADEADAAHWSDEEVLPLHEEWVASVTVSGFGSTFRTIGRVAAISAALIAGLRVVLVVAGRQGSLSQFFSSTSAKKSYDGYQGKEIHFA